MSIIIIIIKAQGIIHSIQSPGEKFQLHPHTFQFMNKIKLSQQMYPICLLEFWASC